MSDSQQLTRFLAKLEKGSRRTNEGGLLLVVVVAAAEKAAAATSLAVSLSPLSLSLLQCQLSVHVFSADHFLVGEKTRKRAGGGPVWLGCLLALFPDPIRFLLRASCPSGIFDTRCCCRYRDGPMGRTEDSAAPV